jgi:hypothetical protein
MAGDGVNQEAGLMAHRGLFGAAADVRCYAVVMREKARNGLKDVYYIQEIQSKRMAGE